MVRTWSGWLRSCYPHGVWCGVLMTACDFSLRTWGGWVPLFTVVLFIPYFTACGFLTGRRHGLEPGMVTGAATAVTGHLIVSLVTIGHAALAGSRAEFLDWVWIEAAFVIPMAVLGALCGLLGAIIAKAPSAARS